MKVLTQGLSEGTVPTYPTSPTKHLQVINIDSEKFIIPNPTPTAHTNTDIMIEHVGSKTLFLGDNDLINRMGGFDESSYMHGNIATLEYALELNLNNYVPGHGPSGPSKQSVTPFLDYLLLIQEHTQNGYEDDLAPYEIKLIVSELLHDYKDWHGMESQLGKHIGKMLSEIEDLDF